jgi:hypothetical protein
VANTVAAAVRNRMFPPEDEADRADTVLETGRSRVPDAAAAAHFLRSSPPQMDRSVKCVLTVRVPDMAHEERWPRFAAAAAEAGAASMLSFQLYPSSRV